MIDQYLKPNVKRGALYYGIIAAIIGILVAIPFLGCLVALLNCFVGPILALGTGYLIAQWGATMSTSMTTRTPLAVQSSSPYTTPAIDGAVGTGVGALIGGIVGWIAGLIVSVGLTGLGVAAGGDTGSAAVGVAAQGIGGIFSIVVTVVFALILGAIGGVLYVVFSQRKSTTPTAPTTPA